MKMIRLYIARMLKRYRKVYSFSKSFYGTLQRTIYWKAYQQYKKDSRNEWQKRGKFYFEAESSYRGPNSPSARQEKFFVDEIRKLSPSRVLEVGCGYGRLLKPIAESVELKHIVGVDFSDTMLSKAKQYINNSEVELILADVAQGLPFVDDAFDVVYTSGVLMHIPPPKDLVARRELIRVTRKYIIHNEIPMAGCYIFSYDNETIYKQMGHKVIRSALAPPALEGIDELFIVVAVEKADHECSQR